MENINKEVNKRVKEIRKKFNYTQEEMGEIMCVTKGMISIIEAGNRAITEAHIKLIAYQLDVNEEWIKTGKGNVFKNKLDEAYQVIKVQEDLSQRELEILKKMVHIDKTDRRKILKIAKEILREE